MVEVNAQCRCDRHKDRHKDVHDRVAVDEAARDQNENVGDQQEDQRVSVDHRFKEMGDGGGNAGNRHHPCHQARVAHVPHDGARLTAGVDDDRKKLPGAQRPVDADADEQAVNSGDRRGLSGSKDAAIDTAQNNDRHHEAPESVLKSKRADLGRSLGKTLEVALSGYPKGSGNQSGTHDKAGDDAGHKLRAG